MCKRPSSVPSIVGTSHGLMWYKLASSGDNKKENASRAQESFQTEIHPKSQTTSQLEFAFHPLFPIYLRLAKKLPCNWKLFQNICLKMWRCHETPKAYKPLQTDSNNGFWRNLRKSSIRALWYFINLHYQENYIAQPS